MTASTGTSHTQRVCRPHALAAAASKTHSSCFAFCLPPIFLLTPANLDGGRRHWRPGIRSRRKTAACANALPVHCKHRLLHKGRIGISADLCIASEIKNWMAFAHPIIINMSSILNMLNDYRSSPPCESTHLEKMASGSPGSSAALLSRKAPCVHQHMLALAPGRSRLPRQLHAIFPLTATNLVGSSPLGIV